jgi:hypothetical protein
MGIVCWSRVELLMVVVLTKGNDMIDRIEDMIVNENEREIAGYARLIGRVRQH